MFFNYMQDNQENEQDESIQAPKPSKRTLTDAQKANLAKGREIGKQRLKEKSDKVREEKLKAEQELKKLELSNSSLKDKAVIKKANNLIKEKLKIKETLGVQDDNDSDEEIIIPIQPKKPKKKQIVYLPPESDSEEEVIYKRAPRKNRALNQVDSHEQSANSNVPTKIIFW